jgi:hypothetical protein
MDQERSVDIERVTRAMDVTRRSILDTVDELKGRVQESADWRHYVAAHPVASLIIAGACGLALARILVPAVRLAGIPLLLAPRLMRRRPPTGLPGAWARLSTAGGVLTQLAALPGLVSQIRQVVGRPSRTPRR